MKRLIALAIAVLWGALVVSQPVTKSQMLPRSHFYSDDGTMITPFSEGILTYTMAYRKSSNDLWDTVDKPLLKLIEDELHIHFEVQDIDASLWDERIKIMFASDDLPDVIWGPIDNLSEYVDQCMDITDLVAEYTNVITAFLESNPIYRKGEEIGGRMYSFPSVVQNSNRAHNFNLAINQRWLYRLGLKAPTTIDELTDVLRAFVRDDPNGNGVADEIGFSFVAGYGVSPAAQTLDFLRCLFGLINDGEDEAQHDVMVVDGEVRFVPAMDGYREMLEWLHMCYEEGLLDRDGFIQTSADFLQKGMDGRLGLVFGGTSISSCVGRELEENYVYWMPTQDSSGKNVVPLQRTPMEFYRHAFTITKDCAHPEYLIAMIEWFNCDETRQLSIYWGEGGVPKEEIVYNKDATTSCGWWYVTVNGEEKIFANQLNYPRDRTYPDYASWRSSVTMNCAPVLIGKELAQDALFYTGEQQRQMDRDEFFSDYFYQEMFPIGQMSAEDSLTRRSQFARIKNYVESFFFDAVINGVNDRKWEAHLQQLEQLNIAEWLEGYQRLYDFLQG